MGALHLDFETRSTLNLSRVGAWRYADAESTAITCVGFAIDDDAVQTWLPLSDAPMPDALRAAAADPNCLAVAHNAGFEVAIARRILEPRYGFPHIPIERWRCTMSAALARALPGALDKAAAALALPISKDAEGRRLMLQMSRPRKPRAGENPDAIYWHEDPEQFARLARYNARDVEVERELHRRSPPLSDAEQALWQLDQVINQRGFGVDVALAKAARAVTRDRLAAINTKLTKITGGAITSVGQVARIESYITARGFC
jgi:DNA polymerase